MAKYKINFTQKNRNSILAVLKYCREMFTTSVMINPEGCVIGRVEISTGMHCRLKNYDLFDGYLKITIHCPYSEELSKLKKTEVLDMVIKDNGGLFIITANNEYAIGKVIEKKEYKKLYGKIMKRYNNYVTRSHFIPLGNELCRRITREGEIVAVGARQYHFMVGKDQIPGIRGKDKAYLTIFLHPSVMAVFFGLIKVDKPEMECYYIFRCIHIVL